MCSEKNFSSRILDLMA